MLNETNMITKIYQSLMSWKESIPLVSWHSVNGWHQQITCPVCVLTRGFAPSCCCFQFPPVSPCRHVWHCFGCAECASLLKPAAIHCALGALSAGCQVRANLPPLHLRTLSDGKKAENGNGPISLFPYKSIINTVSADNTVWDARTQGDFARLPNCAISVCS